MIRPPKHYYTLMPGYVYHSAYQPFSEPLWVMEKKGRAQSLALFGGTGNIAQARLTDLKTGVTKIWYVKKPKGGWRRLLR